MQFALKILVVVRQQVLESQHLPVAEMVGQRYRERIVQQFQQLEVFFCEWLGRLRQDSKTPQLFPLDPQRHSDPGKIRKAQRPCELSGEDGVR
jgi:hypothetical protein